MLAYRSDDRCSAGACTLPAWAMQRRAIRPQAAILQRCLSCLKDYRRAYRKERARCGFCASVPLHVGLARCVELAVARSDGLHDRVGATWRLGPASGLTRCAMGGHHPHPPAAEASLAVSACHCGRETGGSLMLRSWG